ncbi:MAG: flagellar motor switch protein FliM [Bryobacteraceae bacterium]
MPADRVLTQEEIDSVFRNLRDARDADPSNTAQPYDFRRPDRIAKHQLRAIHMLNEAFARNLASSLSAYLRAYVMANLVSVEQLSFLEFTQCLPSPTVIVSLGMKPYEGNAVLEMNPSLVFPILEMLLGGGKVSAVKIEREVTEIEQSIMEGLYRIILNDLREAWHGVTQLSFSIEAHETEPQMLQILAPSEAVVAISLEIRIGDNMGMMNIGIPSIMMKMLRQRFDQQWSVRRSHSTEQEQARILRLVKQSTVRLDARLRGQMMKTEDLMELDAGDVLSFDYPVDRPLRLEINGRYKYTARVVDSGNKRSVALENFIPIVEE